MMQATENQELAPLPEGTERHLVRNHWRGFSDGHSCVYGPLCPTAERDEMSEGDELVIHEHEREDGTRYPGNSCVMIIHEPCELCALEVMEEMYREHERHKALRPWLWELKDVKAAPRAAQAAWVAGAYAVMRGHLGMCFENTVGFPRETREQHPHVIEIRKIMSVLEHALLDPEVLTWELVHRMHGYWRFYEIRPCSFCPALEGEEHWEYMHERAMGDPYP